MKVTNHLAFLFFKKNNKSKSPDSNQLGNYIMSRADHVTTSMIIYKVYSLNRNKEAEENGVLPLPLLVSSAPKAHSSHLLLLLLCHVASLLCHHRRRSRRRWCRSSRRSGCCHPQLHKPSTPISPKRTESLLCQSLSATLGFALSKLHFELRR